MANKTESKQKLPAQKLITCVLPKGIALDVVTALKSEMNIVTLSINSARGMGKITPLAYRGIGAQSEKEILNVVTTSQKADEVFEFIYFKADINRPHGGMMYQCDLTFASPFMLPDLNEQD